MNCKECNRELIKSHNKFCNSSCAAKYNNKTRSINPELPQHKIIKCKCGNIISISKRSSRILCYDCKPNKDTNPIKICKTCGRSNCKHYLCRNQFLIKSDIVKYFGFDKDMIGNEKIFDEFDRIKTYINELYQAHSIIEISQIINYDKHFTTLYAVLHSSGILTPLSASLAISKSIKFGRTNLPTSNKYKHGWHTTWNGNRIFYRSSYELEYATQLDEQKINYDVEALRIEYWDSQKNSYRIAIPDFYLSETNTIVEIKSDYTYDPINLQDKLVSYKSLGYNFKFILNKQECLMV